MTPSAASSRLPMLPTAGALPWSRGQPGTNGPELRDGQCSIPVWTASRSAEADPRDRAGTIHQVMSPLTRDRSPARIRIRHGVLVSCLGTGPARRPGRSASPAARPDPGNIRSRKARTLKRQVRCPVLGPSGSSQTPLPGVYTLPANCGTEAVPARCPLQWSHSGQRKKQTTRTRRRTR